MSDAPFFDGLTGAERDAGRREAVAATERALSAALATGRVNEPLDDGDLTLHRAARFDLPEWVDRLLAANADPNRPSGSFCVTTLGQIAQFKSPTALAIAMRLLAVGCDPNRADAHGRTPLHSAAFFGTAAMVELLIGDGADIEAQTTGALDRPCHHAARGGNLAALERLIAAGARFDVFNRAGKTPFNEAQEAGEADIVARSADRIGRHLFEPRPLRLGACRYRAAMRRLAKLVPGSVGAAPREFLDWLESRRVDPKIGQLLAMAMPTRCMSLHGRDDGELLFDAEAIRASDRGNSHILDAGFLPIASEWDGVRTMYVDTMGGGTLGSIDCESFGSLSPRVVFQPLAPTLGVGIYRIVRGRSTR